MCFSANASFIAAGITGVAGLVAMTRAHAREDMPLASIPLVFSAQQAVEGLLWLNLPVHPEGAATSMLTHLFLVFAKIIWPVLTPLAVMLVEPDNRRRTPMKWLCLAGALTGLFFLWSHFTFPHSARIEGGHIAYSSEPYLPIVAGVLYLAATCIAPLMSSQPAIRALGLIVTVGSLVTYFFYWEAFTSVWCFFAAAASAVIVFHSERASMARRALEQR